MPGEPVAFDKARLLHELQVHQIRLETQNRELREAWKLLEVSRDRYADLYDFTPVGYVTVDDKGIIRGANLTLAAMLGLSRPRLIGLPFHLHVAREDVAAFREHLRKASNTHERVTTELRLGGRRKAAISVVLQSVLVFDAELKAYLCRTAVTDITERKEAEAAVRENEARLHAILDTAVDGIITIDEQGVIESVNAATGRMFGYAAGEMVGRNINMLMPAPHRQAHDGYLSQYRSSGDRKVIGLGREVSGKRKDGSIFPVELSVGEVQLGSRRIFSGILRDVTWRRQAEEALRQERDFSAKVLETADALVIVLDRGGCVVRFNHACERLTGYASEEVEGKVIWNTLLPPEEVARVRVVFEDLRDRDFCGRYENHLLTKSGERRLIAWSNTVLKHSDGSVMHIIGTGLDVTDQYRAENRRQLQYEVAGVLAVARTVEEAVPRLLQAIAAGLDCEVGEFWQVNLASSELSAVHIWHRPSARLELFANHTRTLRFSMFDGLPGRVLRMGKPDWIASVADYVHVNRKEEAARAGLKSALAFPIVVDTRAVGVMVFLSHGVGEPDEDLLQMFATLGSQIGLFMERLRIEGDLRRSEANLAQAQAIAQVGSYEIDLIDHRDVWSAEARRIAGLGPSEIPPTPEEGINKLVHPEDRSRVRAAFARLAGQGIACDLGYRIVRADGTVRFVHVLGKATKDKSGKVVRIVGTTHDITERRALEEEIVAISERERRTIGHDLHDGLGQQLTALEMKCFLLEEDLAADDFAARRRQIQEQVRWMSQTLRECITVTRSLAHGLVPVSLGAEGLVDALRQLANRTQVPGKVQCRFTCRTPVTLENARTATHLYRIAQEAVNNALKHARMRRIHISLALQPGALRLQIEDDGRGLARSRKGKPGMGLDVMRHRAQVIGASLEIESNPGHGVCVICTLPRENHEH